MYRLLSLAALFLALHCALAMPNHPASMLMSGEMSHEADAHNDTAVNSTTSASVEDEDDDNGEDDANEDEDDDDDEIHVKGKSAMCPAKQPELAEIEKQCLSEHKSMKTKHSCMTTDTPTKEVLVIEKDAPNSATIRLETVAESSSTEETTDSPRHKHHARTANYYHCVLMKLDLLNEDEVPSKSKLEAWVTNIIDATQKEQTQERLDHCLSELQDEIEAVENSTESTEETEESTEASSKKKSIQKCDISKMLVCCLHHIECPVIQYP